MAGLALAQGFLGGVDRKAARLQVEVLRRGGVDPGGGVIGHRGKYRQAVLNAFNAAVFTVGQGDQGFEGIVDLALRDDAVGARRVETGLGLEHIGLVRQADVEALVGLIQLAIEGRFFGLGRGQVVLGAQHREIGFGTLQDQVLFGRRQLQCRLLANRLGGL